jgi:hypothetical protein
MIFRNHYTSGQDKVSVDSTERRGGGGDQTQQNCKIYCECFRNIFRSDNRHYSVPGVRWLIFAIELRWVPKSGRRWNPSTHYLRHYVTQNYVILVFLNTRINIARAKSSIETKGTLSIAFLFGLRSVKFRTLAVLPSSG